MAASTWAARELPILEAINDAEEAGRNIDSMDLGPRLEIEPAAVRRAVRILREDGYIDSPGGVMGGDLLRMTLTAKGRRAVGAWPPEIASVDAFTSALEAMIDDEPDEARKGKLRRVLDAVGGVGKEVATSVLTEYAKAATGMG